MDKFTLCSLFDGSGGFPLAASFYGIEATTASEIEPYPIAVTRSRFPNMVHLGDIRSINGADIPPADIISFGSPCQDLSVAGKRAGLKHEEKGDGETTRSGLFIEAIRIIKEMREATDGRYPAFALWENVPGAFTSNRGRDFEAVLDEFIQIVEPGAEVPPAYKGRWPTADLYLGGGWSLSYRTLDAQYWGVPQRRRRIYLIMDFRGERAGEVLFKRDGLRGYPQESDEKGKATPGDTGDGTKRTGKAIGLESHPVDSRIRISDGILQTLTANMKKDGKNGPLIMDNGFIPLENHGNDSRVKIEKSGTIQSLTSRMGTGGGNTPMVAVPFQKKRHAKSREDFETWEESDKTGTLNTFDTGDKRTTTVITLQGSGIDRDDKNGCSGRGFREDISYTLNTIDRHSVLDNKYRVRRLTPLECCRLQGFPDGWGDIDIKQDLTDEEFKFWSDVRKTYAEAMGRKPKEYTKDQILKWYNCLQTDANQYKMWGNGIALPVACYVFEGLAIELNKERENIADYAKENAL